MKKIIVLSVLILGGLSASQADAANFWQKIWKRNATTTASTTVQTGWDGACIVKAIEVREKAIGEAYSGMSKKISAALSVRAQDLASSWALTNRGERLSTRNDAWKSFNTSAKTAKSEYKVAVRGIWASYKSDAAACRIAVDGVEPETEESDL